MSDLTIKVIDNSDAVLEAFEAACLRALERCGMQAEGYAKDLCPTSSGGGRLKNSISHQVKPDEKAVYIGTNVEYAPYVEFGTGAFVSGGRKGWWVYVPGSSGKTKNSGKTYTFEEAKRIMAILRRKGLDAHMTCGKEPRPYLKPAVADHAGTYRNIVKSELKS